MKDYIKIGIEKNLISFNEDMSRILSSTYKCNFLGADNKQ